MKTKGWIEKTVGKEEKANEKEGKIVTWSDYEGNMGKWCVSLD